MKPLFYFTGIVIVLYFIASYFTSCNTNKHNEHNASHWDYSGPNSPDHWSELSAAFIKCAEGHFQSPIDLETYKSDLHKEDILTFNYHPSAIDLINNGHTIKAEIKEKNSLEVFDNLYFLQQIHFHTPAEHQIDGIIYPMEVHLVHADEKGRLAVVGLFVKEGRSNEVFTDFWSQLPGNTNEAIHPKEKCKLNSMIPENHNVLHYKGSLTTPPCSEGVEWLIIETPIEMSKEQILDFRKLYDHNNRPIQPLDGRKVEEFVL